MTRTQLLLAALACYCISTQAADTLPPDFGETPNARFKVSSNPYFRNPPRSMRYFVARMGKNGQRNHFCAVGYKWRKGDIQVWVHWKEEQTLLLWGGSRFPEMMESSLVMSRRSLELGKDTVATPDDINGSTYLVTEAWWRGVANDCQKHGEKYTIKPFKARKSTAE